MLSIGTVKNAAYYEKAVAQSREDYYALKGEAPGRWWGRQAESLELKGEVAEGALSRLVGGVDPGTGERLGRKTAVGAFDLTFSAPKSMSVLYALGPADVREKLVRIHEQAVGEALQYMEDEACHRRHGDGRKGTLRRVDGSGFIAARFRHRVSRPVDMPDGTTRLDPQLHTHCIVANRTRSSENGGWGALDGQDLFRLAKTGGYVYHAAARREATRELGAAWTAVEKGMADIALPRLEALKEAYSSRRGQIREQATEQARDLVVRSDVMTRAEAEQHIDADTALRMLGTDGMRVATLSSRQAKLGGEGPEADLWRSWARIAGDLGVRPEELLDALNRVEATIDFTPAMSRALVLERLTDHVSTFTRHDAVRALAEAAPQGATREELLREADALLEDVAAVRRLTLADRHGDARYTTPEVLEQEQRIVETIRARAGERAGVLSPEVVDQVLADRPHLLTGNGEQAEMVRRLAQGGAGVSTVIGPAGTGKTRALEALVAGYRSEGRHVVGAAYTGAASELLEGQTRAPSYTLHKLLGEWRENAMPPGAVVIVDEAGQVGRRQLAELMALGERDATKLVVVGDPKQLPPMDSGGPFRAMYQFSAEKDRMELTLNRRQRDEGERRLLSMVRAGETDEAVRGYMRRGQVLLAADGARAREAMVGDWFRASQAGGETLLLGHRNVDVDLLNALARQRFVREGLVSGPELCHNGRTYQAGDEVLLTKNDYRRGLDVRNGMRGRVAEVDAEGQRLRVELRDGTERWLPLDRYPHVTHGWAMTVNKAQGQTVDAAFVLRPGGGGQEWHYTALSRGRDPVRYYMVDQHPEADVEGVSHAGELDEKRTVDEVLAAQWARSQAPELTSDFDGPEAQAAATRGTVEGGEEGGPVERDDAIPALAGDQDRSVEQTPTLAPPVVRDADGRGDSEGQAAERGEAVHQLAEGTAPPTREEGAQQGSSEAELLKPTVGGLAAEGSTPVAADREAQTEHERAETADLRFAEELERERVEAERVIDDQVADIHESERGDGAGRSSEMAVDAAEREPRIDEERGTGREHELEPERRPWEIEDELSWSEPEPSIDADRDLEMGM